MALKLAVLALSLTQSITAVLTTKYAAQPPVEYKKLITSKSTTSASSLTRRDVDPESLYPEYNLSVPIDHFQNKCAYEPHEDGTFPLRYWFDAQYYKDGGPVIVLQSGETSGTGRLGFLQKGLIHQLAQATNGIAVVLEHRYYGTSWPTSDLSTENLRFLTTEQALADQAYFSQNVVFAGLEGKNLTAPNAAHIGYGGSYAGAFVAFLRTQYPDVYWGTIASSGVTEAIYDYWEYYEPIRIYGPPACVSATQKLVNVLDTVFMKNNTALADQIKALFGLEDLKYNSDVMNTLSYGIGGWQGRNWDPAINDPTFFEYCGNITANSTLYPSTLNETGVVQNLVRTGGWSNETVSLTTAMLNLAGWVNVSLVSPCADDINGCYNTHNSTFYAQDDLSQTWRSWPYQYCSQWGFLQTGSGVPKTQLPLISRLIDLPFTETVCREAFNITTPPDVEAINKYGGYHITYDRLAIVDGEQDPWRRASPHAPVAGDRVSTTEQPFILIEGAVHHWDENGLFPNETTAILPPAPVKETQREEIAFVKAWMKEWNASRRDQILKDYYGPSDGSL